MNSQAKDLQSVSKELHHEIAQFLYREAQLLDDELLREWLDDMVAPEISYRMVIAEERFRRDRTSARAREVMPYDDNMAALDLRVRQFETGLQSMMDPPQRMLRVITNIRAYHGSVHGEYRVMSCGIAARFRRQYEQEQLAFSRKDVLRRDEGGGLRLASRRIELPGRVVRNKNLLFFL